MAKFLVAALLLLVSANGIAGTSQFSGEKKYYEISYHNLPAGYVEYTVVPSVFEGRKAYQIDSRTLLAMSFLGAVADRDSSSQMYIDRETFKPLFYEAELRSKNNVHRIECRFHGNSASLVMYSNGREIDNIEAVLNDQYYLLDDNNYIHWMLLFKTLDLSKTEQNVNAIVPHEMTNTSASIVRDKQSEGPAHYGRKIVIQNQVLRARIRKDTRDLERLDVPEQNLEVVVSDASIINRMTRVELADTILFPVAIKGSIDDLQHVKVRLKARIYGKPVSMADLNSTRQRFTGALSESYIDGVFEVDSRTLVPDRPVGFPLQQKLDTTLERYIRPEIGIEADDQLIRATAEEVTKGAATTWEAAVRIANYIHKNIRNEEFTQGSPRSTLITKTGDAGEKARTAVSMCRAVRIPARLAGGIVYVPFKGGAFTQYVWIEVFVGDQGWVPLDPTMGQYDRVDATHIKVWEEGTFTDVEISIVEQVYDRTADQTRTFDIGRTVGTTVYRYTVDGRVIGYSRATTERTTAGSTDGYLMKSSLVLDAAKANSDYRIQAESDLYLDKNGYPVKYYFTSVTNNKEKRITCVFESGKIRAEVVERNERLEAEIAVKKDTYCVDKDMISQWALAMRKQVLAVGKTVKLVGFMPQEAMPYELLIQVVRKESINVGTRTFETYVCDVPLLEEAFWITTEGQLLRIEKPSQGLVIELMEE
jgi:hypothetical protein